MSIAEAAIGWLAPPICVGCRDEGSALCSACAQSEILPYGSRCWRCGSMTKNTKTCKRCRPGSPRYVWVTTDYQGAAKALVQTYKFKHLRVAARPMAKLMADTFLNNNTDEDIAKANYLVVPVPTATSRKRERSFGHSELLAKNLAQILKLDFTSALGRLGQDKQRGAKRQQRLSQMEGKYFVKHHRIIKGRNILIIDDVLTTGGTIKATYSALKAAGAARVDAAIFAKKL